MSAAALESPHLAETKARASLKVLRRVVRAAAKNPAKEKSIHDLRVAIRRFKQILRVYEAYFDHTRKMRRSLSGLMDLCGAARNCDVALDVLNAGGAPAGRVLRQALKKRRSEATSELAATLEDWTSRSHMNRWPDWLRAKLSGDLSCELPSAGFSREFLASGASAARAGAAYRQMHRFRLLVKRTRYTLEILGDPQERLGLLRALQDRLGAINDCVATADLLTEVDMNPAERRRIKAALNRLAATRCAEFRSYWREEFGRKGTSRRMK
jgi:CHAD domain-containing protein